MSLNAYSIQREEFLPCYDDFSNCDSNCTQPITKNMTLYFPGYNCPLYVSYLYKECYCPEKRIFIDIVYVRIGGANGSPMNYPECCKIFCYLYPPGTANGDCTNFWDCYNLNPSNSGNFANLMLNLYDQISKIEFYEHHNNSPYLCEYGNTLKIAYYWPSKCTGFCVYELKPKEGEGFAYVVTPEACSENYCCGKIVEYCINPNGELNEFIISESELGGECPPYIYLKCKHKIGDIVDIMGKEHIVINVKETNCTMPCDPDYAPNN